jgi:hypothetical protein
MDQKVLFCFLPDSSMVRDLTGMENGTMTSSPDTNPTTVANSAATQTLTPATTTEALNILITTN